MLPTLVILNSYMFTFVTFTGGDLNTATLSCGFTEQWFTFIGDRNWGG